MRRLPRLLTQWFGAALEAYKLKTRKNYVDADTTLALHLACETGFQAISKAAGKKEDAISAALAGNPHRDVVLMAYQETAVRPRLLDLYLP